MMALSTSEATLITAELLIRKGQIRGETHEEQRAVCLVVKRQSAAARSQIARITSQPTARKRQRLCETRDETIYETNGKLLKQNIHDEENGTFWKATKTKWLMTADRLCAHAEKA